MFIIPNYDFKATLLCFIIPSIQKRFISINNTRLRSWDYTNNNSGFTKPKMAIWCLFLLMKIIHMGIFVFLISHGISGGRSWIIDFKLNLNHWLLIKGLWFKCSTFILILKEHMWWAFGSVFLLERKLIIVLILGGINNSITCHIN